MYTIEAHYKTKNSFHTYETDTTLNASWTLEVAKENLSRIKEHYRAVCDRNNYYSIGSKKGDELKNIISSKDWFVAEDNGYKDSSLWENCINLKENDGTFKHYSVEWCGYFETLIHAKVKRS